MSDSDANAIAVQISDAALTAPVLERIVSAAAVQAALPVDRLVNALAAVDSIAVAAGRVLDEADPRRFKVLIREGEIKLVIDELADGQADAVLHATRIPAIGDVLERMATAVATETGEGGSSLVMTFT
ncbi:MAG: hypothetical protein ACRDKI_04725 [Solirubrobacterales bacterium]